MPAGCAMDHFSGHRLVRPEDGEFVATTWPSTDELTKEDGMGVPSTSNDEEIIALRAIVEGTARSTGEGFFESLVRHLATAIRVSLAFVAEFAGVATRVPTLAYLSKGELREHEGF